MLAKADETNKQKGTPVRDRVLAWRQRLRESGKQVVAIDLSNDVVNFVDQQKAKRGVQGRGLIIEEALKEYMAKHGA